MKIRFTSTAILITVLALSGCSGSNSDGPYGGHSEKWYEQHEKARSAENGWCRSTASTRAQERGASCRNAGNASVAYWNSPEGEKAFKAAMNKFDTVPPGTFK